MFKLIIALIGIIIGVLLGRIAPEELNKGKKYFILLKKILFLIMLIVLGYFLKGNYLLLTLSQIIGFGLFYLNIKKYGWYLEGINYLFFVVFYFLNTDFNFKLIISSLLFFYGLPLGSLIYHEKQKRS